MLDASLLSLLFQDKGLVGFQLYLCCEMLVNVVVGIYGTVGEYQSDAAAALPRSSLIFQSLSEHFVLIQHS